MSETRPAIVVAAGGDGDRMGGNKPERELAGKSLLNHSLAWALAHSDEVAIAVRAKDQVAEQSTVPLLIDRIGGIGPISALDSAFRFAAQQGCETVMLIGCDQPFLPSNLPLMLKQKIGANGCAMPVSKGRDHPMAALWRVNCAALAEYIDGEGQSLWRFAEIVGVTRVEWDQESDPEPFANINDPVALAKAERQLSPRSD